MKKPFTRVLSFAMSALMLTSAGAASLSVNAASDDDLGKVRVVVKNETYTTENGAPWDGVLVDEWVSLSADSDMLTALSEAVKTASSDYTVTIESSSYGDYLSEINGVSASQNGAYSGWYMFFNDVPISTSGSAYNTADGTLEAGDIISAEYTSDGSGYDIGLNYFGNDTTLKAITFEGASLDDEFISSTTEYTLVINTPTADVTVTPTATNRCFQVTTSMKTSASADEAASYKRSESITVADGNQIVVTVGDSTTYTFTVKYVPETQLVQEKVDETAENLSTPDTLVVGNEWEIVGLARADKLTDEKAKAYTKSVEDYVTGIGSAQISDTKSTENLKLIIALTAVGKNAADIASYDLTAPLADFDYVTKQGLNGAVYALIALDTAGYQIPNTDAENVTTREKLISYILENQVANGGWTYYGDTADSDMTAMAIQALAPYYSTSEDVKAALDTALDILSNMQLEDGTFGSYGSNTCSTAQALVALTSLNIDPTTDARFIKNGSSVIDGLLSFSVDGGFCSGYTDDYDQMSTQQAFYALVSYLRINSGETSLYDMTSDVAAMYEVGDVNMDGTIDITDATLVQKYIAKICVISNAQLANTNVNGDDSIDITDATQIQKIIAKIV